MSSPRDETSLAETGFQSGARGLGVRRIRAGHIAPGMALVVRPRLGASRAAPGHAAGRALPHPRPRRPRRHGRGLPGRGSAARAERRAEVPAAGRRRRSAAARPVPSRGAHRAPGVAPQRLPRLRHRRGPRPRLPDDGADRRRGSGRAAEARRPLPGRARHRDRAPDLRRPGRGARLRRAAPRSQAGQHHARRGRPRPHHRLRPGRPRRHLHRHPIRDAGLHGARAARRQGRESAERPLLARPRPLRDLHGQARLRGDDDRRAAAHARRRRPGVAQRRARAGSGGRARDPALPLARSDRAAGERDRGVRGAARRRSAGRGARRRRDAVAGDGRRRRPHGRGAAAHRPRRRWPRSSSASRVLVGLRRPRRLPPLRAGGAVGTGARVSRPPGDRAARLPGDAGRCLRSLLRRRRLSARGPASATAPIAGRSWLRPDAGVRLLVSHQPRAARADRGRHAADRRRSAAAQSKA